MKLGTVKTECIAAVQVKTLGWTQKIASLKNCLFLFFFFSFYWGKHFSVWKPAPCMTQSSIPFLGAYYWNDKEGKKKPQTHTTSLSNSPASSASAGAQVLLYFKPRWRCLSWRKYLSMCLITSTWLALVTLQGSLWGPAENFQPKTVFN